MGASAAAEPLHHASTQLYEQAVDHHKRQEHRAAADLYRQHLRERPTDAVAVAALAACLVCEDGSGSKQVRVCIAELVQHVCE